MKICYANKGISVHDQKFLRFFADKKKEFDVHLLSYYGKKLSDINGMTIHQIPIPSPELAFPVASALTPLLIRKIKPDIVHGNYLLTYGFYAALAHYHPLLQMAWGSDVLIAPKNRVYRPIVKYSLKHADLVTVDCEIGKKAIVKLGYPAENVVVFPWGIDIKKFNPHVDGKNIRKNLDWQDNLIVVCTRQHKPVYGVDYLINAIPDVIKKEPTVRFLLIGSGPLTDDLKQRVNDLKIEKYVKFIGMIPNDELPEYLAASDLYVSSSLSDGTSVCLLEAMACGLPVVVTDIDAILEWVTEGENGLVVPKKNPVALAKAICMLLEDDNLRRTFGKRNYKIARDRASWDDNVKILEGMYLSLAKR